MRAYIQHNWSLPKKNLVFFSNIFPIFKTVTIKHLKAIHLTLLHLRRKLSLKPVILTYCIYLSLPWRNHLQSDILLVAFEREKTIRDGEREWVGVSSARASRGWEVIPPEECVLSFWQQRVQLWMLMGDGSKNKGQSSTTSPTEIPKTWGI